jgi:hypothetical protein
VIAPRVAPGELDLQTAGDDEFAPEGLRANLEKAYKLLVKAKPVVVEAASPYRTSRPVEIVFGVRAALRHLGTIAGWHDRRRSAYFAAAYFAAWSLHLLLFASVGLLVALIVHPPARRMLFPPLRTVAGPMPYPDSQKVVDKIAPTATTLTDKAARTTRSLRRSCP